MILFFPSGTRDSRPSSHLRVYEMEGELEERGFRCLVVDSRCREDVKRCFLDEAPDGTIVYIQKMGAKQIRKAHLLMHKERCTVIYDVDDEDTGQDHFDMLRFADAVVAGSTFVEEEARSFNSRVCLVHSMTDCEVYSFVDRSRKPVDMPIRIVWSEHWANAYFEDFVEIAPALRRLQAEYNIEMVLQGFRADDHPSLTSRPDLRGMIDRFSKEVPFAEIDEVMPIDEFLDRGVRRIKECDIGVMPFHAQRKGKAAQNLRSFMSVGLACVATVGNDHDHVIRDGETGFLVGRTGDYANTWYELLKTLVLDREKRLQVGRAASDDILSKFSRQRSADKVAYFLQSLGEIPEKGR